MPGSFKIQEMRLAGPGQYVEEGESFHWTAARSQPDPGRGGARAAPLKPWPMPLMQRTVRTDYPGARDPTEHVLGPAYEPFTLNGTWDSRYNYKGYAEEERARFEAMVARGNVVRISFEAHEFLGIITQFTPTYLKEWEIEYAFTVSVHRRADAPALAPRVPSAIVSVEVSHDRVFLMGSKLAEDAKREKPKALPASVADQVSLEIEKIQVGIAQIGEALDTRRGVLKPISDFGRIASQFRAVQSDALGLADKLVTVKAGVEYASRTALDVLDFEVWSRGVRTDGRLLMGTSRTAEKETRERGQPKAKGTYRPHKGESLYAISRKVYGDPFAWRTIAEANHLIVTMLTGDEVLEIPERGDG